MCAWCFLDVVCLSIDIFTMWMRLPAVLEWQWLNGKMPVLLILRLRVWILIRSLWASWTWHSVIATHLKNTTLNSTWNSSGNQHSRSLASKNRTTTVNFFVNHFSYSFFSLEKCVLWVVWMLCAYQWTFWPCEWGCSSGL